MQRGKEGLESRRWHVVANYRQLGIEISSTVV